MQIINQLIFDESDMAFHPMMGNSYKLNPIAKEIITLLRHGLSKEEIIQQIVENYDVNENDVYIDINDFITKLKVYGLYI